MKLFVSNISYRAEESDLRQLFANYTVLDLALCRDRETGQPRGFAFVDVDGDEEDAQMVIAALDGTELLGRRLNVQRARPRESSGGGRYRGRDGNRRAAAGNW